MSDLPVTASTASNPSASNPTGSTTSQAPGLQGVVERITYHNPENGYTIAKVEAKGHDDLITVVGSFAQLQPGQTMAFWGEWKEHPQYGSQFLAARFQETKPATLTGIEKYLGSGLIKGVGPVTARRIVNFFGLETLEVIEQHSDRLKEVPGVGAYRIQKIQQAWEEQKAIKEVMLFLQSHQVSTTHAVKIYKTYGDASIPTVQNNPYQLAQDIWGIGFKTADQIARNLGIPEDSEQRLQAGLSFALLTATEDGHCYLPLDELLEQSAVLLAVEDAPDIQARLKDNARQLVRTDRIKSERIKTDVDPTETDPLIACYHPPLYVAEVGLTELMHRLLRSPLPTDPGRVQDWLGRYTQKYELQLSDEQMQAVLLAAQQRVVILTGGPGTGKTTTTRTITALWRAMGKTVLQASPTGRAAQRLSEVTGHEAKTIHRLLEFDPRLMQFKRNPDNPLDADAVVIDEASMLDIVLAYNLFKAIPPTAQVLLVGDHDQLPSVGPGNVLADLLSSGSVPTARLTQVFRQAAQSLIITNAHRINRGDMPKLIAPASAGSGSRVGSDQDPAADCLFLAAPTPEEVVSGIQTLLTQDLKDWDPMQDVQVLCPMNRGMVGANNLNTVLQQVLNPPTQGRIQLDRGKRLYREGDRVIQLRNNYDLNVFNGDLGIIQVIDPEDQALRIQFGAKEVIYEFADLNELSLAYAITIHRSQGSEYPVGILPIHTQHFPMLNRNLIYTGLTRARRLAVFVGTVKAIALAVKQVKSQHRYTRLSERVESTVKPVS